MRFDLASIRSGAGIDPKASLFPPWLCTGKVLLRTEGGKHRRSWELELWVRLSPVVGPYVMT